MTPSQLEALLRRAQHAIVRGHGYVILDAREAKWLAVTALLWADDARKDMERAA